MKEEHAGEFVAAEYDPTTTEHVLTLVVAVPKEFDSGLAVSLFNLAVHLPVDTRKLKLAGVTALELNERLEFLRFFFYVPLIHMFNQPSTQKRIGRFALSHVTLTKNGEGWPSIACQKNGISRVIDALSYQSWSGNSAHSLARDARCLNHGQILTAEYGGPPGVQCHHAGNTIPDESHRFRCSRDLRPLSDDSSAQIL